VLLGRMWVFLLMLVEQEGEDPVHDFVADMSLREVGPVQTIKAISPHNTCLVVCLVAFITVDEETIVLGLKKCIVECVHELLNRIEVVTSKSCMEIEIVKLNLAIIFLVDKISKPFSEADLILFVSLAQ